MEFKWYKYGDEGLKDGFDIRKEVFCKEIGFSEEFEFDDSDKNSLHLVCYEDGHPVCCGRIFPERQGVLHFGRLRRPLKYRGKKYGQATLKEAINKCKQLGAYKIILGAKYDKKEFYESFGFSEYGEIFYEEEIPHVMMKLELPVENGFVWCDYSDKTAKEGFELRRKVFCGEVGFSNDVAFDEKDKIAMHLVEYQDGQVVGTARVLWENENTWYFGRLCASPNLRGKGYGKAIVNEIIRKAKEQNISNLILGAKYDKKGFYESLGFRAYGEVFCEEGIPHIMMKKI